MPSPARLPPFSVLLDDLGAPSAKKLGKALGVSARTVTRWRQAEQAPRVVMLALFWVFRWGQSLLNAEMTCSADLHRALAASLKADRDQLRMQVRLLGSIGDFGSANDPVPDAPTQPADARPAAPRPTIAANGPAQRAALLLSEEEWQRTLHRMQKRRLKRMRKDKHDAAKRSGDAQDAA